MEQKFADVRKTLESVEEAKSQVARLQRSVAYLQEKCTAGTAFYGVKGKSGGQGPEELWMKLSDEKEKLRHQEHYVWEQQTLLEQRIEQLPKARWRMVLRCHYLDGMSLPEVAEELSRATGREFSVYQIYRLHRQALGAAEKLWSVS